MTIFSGQTCSAGSRVLMETSICEQLIERIAERFRVLQSGPALQDLDCGPLVSREQKWTADAAFDFSRKGHE